MEKRITSMTIALKTGTCFQQPRRHWKYAENAEINGL